MGIPPTLKRVSWEEVHIMRVLNGQLAEHWVVADNLGLMQGLGLLPPPTRRWNASPTPWRGLLSER